MPTESPPGELGMRAADFTLTATDNRTYTLDDLKGAQGLVIVFMCNHCPYVKAVMPNLIRDAVDLKRIGINMAGINSNDANAYPDDAFAPMIDFANEWRLPFPYLHDNTQAIARAYGAVCTPECFGFDANLRLRYRGRIDASRKEALSDTHRDLYEAMLEIGTQNETSAQQFPALGCSIKWITP